MTTTPSLSDGLMTEDEALKRATAAAQRADEEGQKGVPRIDLMDVHLAAARAWLNIAEALRSQARRSRTQEPSK
jgi:hypothetical protein